MKYKETKLKSIKHVKGRAVGFIIDAVRLPNGKKGSREYLDHPGAVALVPVLPSKKIILVKQFRYPVGKITWELPAGKLDQNESAYICAKRELSEETGYRATSLKRLVSFWPTPAFANEVIHIYVAKGLKKGLAHPDDDEFINTQAWKMSDILKAVQTGKIKDSKTIIGILSYLNF